MAAREPAQGARAVQAAVEAQTPVPAERPRRRRRSGTAVGAEQLDEIPGAGDDAIDAIAKIDDRLVVLLNPDRLLAGSGDIAYA